MRRRPGFSGKPLNSPKENNRVHHLFHRTAGAVLLGFSFATVSPALAQQPATAPLAKPAAPAPAAPAAQPTPQQISVARDVVLYSGIARSFQVVVPQYLDQIGSSLTRTRPDLIRDLNVVMEQVKPEFDKRIDEMVDNAARIYAANLNEQQLKDASAFFKSASGVAYVQVQPALMGDLFPKMQAWQKQLSEDMVTRIRAEMKKKGHDI
ncbi:MAG: DUF2059 domain-containing protein [Methylobacteriaceae bacterium]|nr:DUF2059 domain-containing protein [Methylobacteriaceae bacterium]